MDDKFQPAYPYNFHHKAEFFRLNFCGPLSAACEFVDLLYLWYHPRRISTFWPAKESNLSWKMWEFEEIWIFSKGLSLYWMKILSWKWMSTFLPNSNNHPCSCSLLRALPQRLNMIFLWNVPSHCIWQRSSQSSFNFASPTFFGLYFWIDFLKYSNSGLLGWQIYPLIHIRQSPRVSDHYEAAFFYLRYSFHKFVPASVFG